MKPVVSLLLLCTFTFGQTMPQCSVFNNPKIGPFITSVVGTQDHINGAHVYTNEQIGSATYSGQGYGLVCFTTCKADSDTGMSEGGLYATPGIKHVDAIADSHGIATAYGQAVASSTGAAEVDQCPLVGGCPMAVTVGPVTFSGAHLIYTQTTNYTNTCARHVLPSKPGGCPEPPGTTCPAGERWVPQICACNVSPIALDVTGKVSRIITRDGIMPAGVFSDPKTNYITFDIKGNGHLEKVSFMLPDSGLMWLVYWDGHRAHMFGSFSKHADWKKTGERNAWSALDWFDQPAVLKEAEAYGDEREQLRGNGNGVIDPPDTVYSRLRLWDPQDCFKDRDAECVATPDRLHMLSEYRFDNISLFWTSSKEVDEKSGVQLGSYSLTNVLPGMPQTSHDNRLAMDFWISKHRD